MCFVLNIAWLELPHHSFLHSLLIRSLFISLFFRFIGKEKAGGTEREREISPISWFSPWKSTEIRASSSQNKGLEIQSATCVAGTLLLQQSSAASQSNHRQEAEMWNRATTEAQAFPCRLRASQATPLPLCPMPVPCPLLRMATLWLCL